LPVKVLGVLNTVESLWMGVESVAAERIGPDENDDQRGDEHRIRHECNEARVKIAPATT
jgi:hypothetical protein